MRQPDSELGSFSLAAMQLDFSPVRVQDVPGDAETQPHPLFNLSPLLTPVERFKN